MFFLIMSHVHLVYHSGMETFWKKVSKIDNGCWEWIGTIKNGYGIFHLAGSKILAHRFSAWLAEILPDLDRNENRFVLHKCDNPRCVNPDHLFLGSQAENVRDCAAKGRLGGFIR